MSFDDIPIPGEIIEVEGDKKTNTIFMLALSTCHWCKKGKQWLKDNNYNYRFVDVDNLPIEEKREFKREVSKLFNTMVRYPFLIVDGQKFYAGFNIDNWKEMLLE
ncbi:MAG: glutaredoxin family protein [Candidatus Heimdallarchaeota archaeon]|nr:glutaredoxin family protein [Candidatus Heimdallarchaeota archaeon]